MKDMQKCMMRQLEQTHWIIVSILKEMGKHSWYFKLSMAEWTRQSTSQGSNITDKLVDDEQVYEEFRWPEGKTDPRRGLASQVLILAMINMEFLSSGSSSPWISMVERVKPWQKMFCIRIARCLTCLQKKLSFPELLTRYIGGHTLLKTLAFNTSS